MGATSARLRLHRRTGTHGQLTELTWLLPCRNQSISSDENCAPVAKDRDANSTGTPIGRLHQEKRQSRSLEAVPTIERGHGTASAIVL